MVELRDLEEMMDAMDATDGYRKVLRYIVKEKDTSGEFEPGSMQISYRDLAKGADVSLGTVTRAFVHWEHQGVILVQSASNRREANIIQYLGPPLETDNHPLSPIVKELASLKKDAERLSEALSVVQHKIEHLIRELQNDELPVLKGQKLRRSGEIEGKIVYVLEDEQNESKEE